MNLLKVVVFISSRDNPYATSSASKLYHFTSGQVVPPEAPEQLLTFFNRVRNEYINFRKERYITKEKKLSDTIKRISLPPFLPKGKDKKQKPVSSKEVIKKAMKEVGRSQKHIDIARSRGIPMRKISQFDHTDDNFLFDGEGTSKPEKHKIISELEKYSANEDYNLVKENNQLTAIIVDFMSLIRKVPFTKVKTIGEALESAWKIIMNISKAE